MANYDAILFDFDGVLLDSEPIHCDCWREVLTPLGIVFDWKLYERHCVGVADREMLEFLARLSDPPLPVERLWQEYGAKNRRFLDRVASDPPFPQATRELLRELAPHYRLGVVTSSGRAEVEPLLLAGGLRPLLDVVVYGDDVKKHKPAPDPYILASQRIQARRVLVVEDSSPGVESALAAGLDVIRVGNASEVAGLVRERLKDGGPMFR